MPDWIKRKDVDLRTQSATLSEGIAADPSVYGISIEQSDDLAMKRESFVQALAVATAPGTNSKVAVAEKDAARGLLVAAMRQVANIARSRPGLVPGQLIAIGLRPAEPRRRRVNGPDTAPYVQILGVSGRSVTVRVSDTDNPYRSAKPRDVSSAAVFTHVSEEYPDGPVHWRPAGQKTRTTFTIDFDNPEIPSGAKVWITAAWLGTRQQPGPLATPAYTYVSGRPVFKLRVLSAAA